MEQAIPTDAELLNRIKAFCTDHNLKPSTFGRMAVGDGSLISNLEAGRSPTLKMAGRIAAFMANYRPAPEQAAA